MQELQLTLEQKTNVPQNSGPRQPMQQHARVCPPLGGCLGDAVDGEEQRDLQVRRRRAAHAYNSGFGV